MRFGQQLRSSLIKDWYYHYIDYDELKNALQTDFVSQPTSSNQKPQRKQWTNEDEERFVRLLETELDKVFTFQRVKSQEIVRRIKASEKEVNEVVQRHTQYEAEQARNGGNAPDTDATQQELEEDFMLLEEDLSDIIADVHDLAKYTQLNYTGFQKIIKKHDKQTGWHLKPVFAARLRAKPFFKDNYDQFVINLSKSYDLVRTRGNPAKGDSAAGGSQQNFVRNTTKYWVHQDNITELKLIILKHLPVLVFNASKEFELKDTAISSIYYDNTDTWELYTGRLKKTEGAEAIRLRWYGGMESDTIFVERKTHREDWTGEKSVKARFTLKEKNVNDFMLGKYTVDQAFEKMERDGKKGKEEIENLKQLAREIQYRVITRKLVPVTRSFYHRTAFQLPGDARVRISLDTELTMTREDNLDGRQRTGKNWRRMDIGIDWPFNQLPSEDVERFPYAVLEVKLQTAAGQTPPEWIRELTSSHLVEAVPKYSKFIHGTATLNPKRIDLLPFWMPQMDVDIRKPVTHKFGIERPGQSTDPSTTNLDEDTDDEEVGHLLGDGQANIGDDDENINVRRLRAARDANEQHEADQLRDYGTLPGENGTAPGNHLDGEERAGEVHEDDEPWPLYEDHNEEDDLEEAKRIGGITYYAILARHYLKEAGQAVLGTAKKATPTPKPTPIPQDGPSMGVPKTGVQGKRFQAPPGKRIHVPVRVEPKVHFAAERTFLSWLEFSIIIGSIAATLLNFGDNVSLAASWAFTILADLSILYSLGLYLWRVQMIKSRRAVSYHDKWGPTILCFGLLLSVAIAFGFRFTKGGEGGLKDRPNGDRYLMGGNESKLHYVS